MSLLGGGAAGAARQAFTGRVVQVDDGDTVRVLRDGEAVRVRIHGIDAPENGQLHAREARDLAVRLLLGRAVSVTMRDVDAYGRLVAELVVDGRDVGTKLVAAGAAWHYTQYSDDPGLAAAERQARAARRGLWASPGATAPWEFRAAERAAAAAATISGPVVFRGNRTSRVFHAPGCQHYDCPNCTVSFSSAAAARTAGYRPHLECVSAVERR